MVWKQYTLEKSKLIMFGIKINIMYTFTHA